MQSAENHGKMLPILFTLTSRSDSDFECSNISCNKNKLDGVGLNSNGLDHDVQKNGGESLWFSSDCSVDVAANLFFMCTLRS